MFVNNANAGYTGAVTIRNGAILEYGNASALSNASSITVENLGEFSISNLTTSKAITINSGGYLAFQNGNSGNQSGAVTLNGNATVRLQDWYGGTTRNGTISGVISGAGGLTVTNGSVGGPGGQLILSGSNNFSGGITLTSGTLRVANANAIGGNNIVANGNAGIFLTTNVTTTGAITGTGTLNNDVDNGGASWNITGDMSGFQGTFRFGSGTNTRNNVNIGGATDASMDMSQATIALSGNTSGGARALRLGGSGPSATFKVGDLNGAGQLNANNGLTIEVGALNSNSTFSGPIQQSNGVATTSAVRKVGTGTWTLTGTHNYTGGTTVNSGTLQVGAGTTSGQLGSGAIAVNSAGNLVYSRSDSVTVGNALSGSGALHHFGTGTLILTGANTSTGTINVSGGGTLQANTAVPSATINIANNGKLLRGTGAIGGRVELANGALLTQANNAIQTFTLDGGLTVNAGAMLAFDLGATPDTIALGSGTVSALGASTINLTDLGGIAPGTYDLMTFGSGSGLANFVLGTQPIGYGFSLNPTSTSLQLTVAVIPSPEQAYWTGDQSTAWTTVNAGNNTNWATSSTLATDTNQVPGLATTVHFDHITTNISTTLGSSLAIENLLFGDGTINTGNVEIGGAGDTLGILSAAGINVAGGSATNTISVGTVNLNTSQSWTNNSSGTLAVTSVLTGVTSGLTINGTGPVLLSGNNTYAGGTTLSSGTLVLGHANAMGDGTVAINGGTLDLNGVAAVLAGVTNTAASSTITNSNASSATLTFNGGTAAGTIQNGTGAVSVANNGGTLVLTNTNSYSGGTTVNGGTISAATDEATGTGSITLNGGVFAVTGTYATSKSITVSANSGLDIATGQTLTFNGTLGPIVPAQLGTLTRTGAGTLIVTGDSFGTSDGTIALNGGYTRIDNFGALGSIIAPTSIGNGAMLDLNGQTIFENFNGVAGTGVGGAGAIVNNSTTPAAIVSATVSTNSSFTVGGSGDVSLDRVMRASGSGALTLTKVGGGILTLTGTGENAWFGVTVNSGTVLLAKTDNKASDDLVIANGAVAKIDYATSGAAGQIYDGSALSVDGIFDLNGYNELVGRLTGAGALGLVKNNGVGGSVLSVGGLNATGGVYAGSIQDGTGALGFTKTGTGVQTLTGVNSYSGGTTVDAGTLIISGTHTGAGSTNVNGGVLAVGGTLASAGAVNVNAGASSAGTLVGAGTLGTLIVSADNGSNIARVDPGTSPTVTGTMTASGLSSNGGDLHFDLYTVGTNADRLNVNGAVSFNAASTVTVGGTPSSGTYVLVDSTSPITYGTAPTLVTPSLAGARPSSFTPDTTTDNTQYRVVITSGAQSMNWTGTDGTNPTFWDVDNSLNWTSSDQKFFNLDSVIFGNGPTNRNINIVAAVNPSAVTVNNSAGNDYTFAGVGSITGVGGLTKSGAGKLTITTAHSYSGGTTINGGTLELTDAGIAGSGGILNNSVLELNHTGAVTYPQAVSGSGVLVKTGGGTTTITGAMSHTGGTAINSGTLVLNNGSVLGSGTVTINGGALNNLVSNAVLANNIDVAGPGGQINTGIVNLTITGSLGGSGSLLLGNGAVNASVFVNLAANNMTSGTIQLANSTNAVRLSTTTSGNPNVAFVFSNTTANRNSLDFAEGSIMFGSMTGAGIIGGNNPDLGTGGTNRKTIVTGHLGLNDAFTGTVTNGVAGQLAITKVGTGTLTLTGNNTYSGPTTVQGGRIVLGNNGAQNAWAPVLTIAGGYADVQSGRLAFAYSGSATTPAATILGILDAGYDLTPKFSDGQIRTTNAPDADKGLGWIDDVKNSQVVVGYTWYGDATLDGKVNTLDFNMLAGSFAGSSKVWAQGDFNYDGLVDSTDFNSLVSNYGKTGLAAPVPSLSLGAVVPEPAGVGLVAMALTGLAGRRRRK